MDFADRDFLVTLNSSYFPKKELVADLVFILSTDIHVLIFFVAFNFFFFFLLNRNKNYYTC